MDEIVLIDKPFGMTSFDVIRQLRRRTGIKKWGHAGTLDPLATGLMILGCEKGTKRLSELIKLDKEYITEVLVGEKRSTGDMEGEVLEECDVSEIAEADIVAAIEKLIGTLTLPVSAYSAIKVDGKAMYKRAREAEKKGEQVTDVPMREMKVHTAVLLEIQNTTVNRGMRMIVKIRFFVGSGTYIRSLAEELGRLLGYPATLFSLRRTKVGEYDIKDAKHLSEFVREI
ncbi:MAG: tRNA pseudouridine55 synthase [Candidatus Azotimanducaceae bacterium]|jgi:tRNA pseudouridine55 synthase